MKNRSSEEERREGFDRASETPYDVAILGAGISGARIFHELSRQGYRVLLIDRGDFACATSQASGMMIWGGLLYLKDLDFLTVRKLCRARDALIEQMPGKVQPQPLRYLPRMEALRNRHAVRAGMMLYWLFGSSRRLMPASDPSFPEMAILRSELFRESLTFEEAVIQGSDSRFVLEWILSAEGPGNCALNYCSAQEASFDASENSWRLDLRDELAGGERAVTARYLINATGVWTDRLNDALGIESPYRHELSKGVYVSFPRPELMKDTLIFDTGKDEDTLTFSPWGPVALCGPTETGVSSLTEGFRPAPEDVRFLLKLAGENLDTRCEVTDIISMRCGIRPLAVRRGFSKPVHSLKLSRKHRIHLDHHKNVLAVYGGKLTSCGLMAEEVRSLISPDLPTRPPRVFPDLDEPVRSSFPGLDESVPDPEWCRDHEHCRTLEDYLRRRTNISQWIPRQGLGTRGENRETLGRLARVFHRDEHEAKQVLAAYEDEVLRNHDEVLAAV